MKGACVVQDGYGWALARAQAPCCLAVAVNAANLMHAVRHHPSLSTESAADASMALWPGCLKSGMKSEAEAGNL